MVFSALTVKKPKTKHVAAKVLMVCHPSCNLLHKTCTDACSAMSAKDTDVAQMTYLP